MAADFKKEVSMEACAFCGREYAVEEAWRYDSTRDELVCPACDVAAQQERARQRQEARAQLAEKRGEWN